MEAALGQLVHTDMLEKLKGAVSCQSSLQKSWIPLQEGEEKDPGPGPGTARAESVKSSKSHPQGFTLTKEERTAAFAAGTGLQRREALTAHSLPPSIHLAGVFCQKINGAPGSRAAFPNVHTWFGIRGAF